MEKEVYVTKTVEELLFEGYHDRILSLGNQLKAWGLDMDEFLPEKFGWYFDVRFFSSPSSVYFTIRSIEKILILVRYLLVQKNASNDATFFNVNTGTDDLNFMGKLNSFNYKTRSGVYTDPCDQVHGSLGDLWPKNISKEKVASLYISDFCG